MDKTVINKGMGLDLHIVKAKRVDRPGEWVKGFVYFNKDERKHPSKVFIMTPTISGKVKQVEVFYNSVCRPTGPKDNKGKEIFEGDILGDWNEVDGVMVQSRLQVFWCEKTSSFRLDSSYHQDQSHSDLLSEELELDAYEVIGNIHDTPTNKG